MNPGSGKSISDVGRLRVAVVTQYFHPEDFRINDLVSELVERGHEVHVLTGNPNYPNGEFYAGFGGLRPRRDTFEGTQVVRVPMLARGNGSGARLLLNYLVFAASATILGPVLLRGRFDVVFTFQVSPVTVAVPALVLAGIKRAPAVMWVQDLWPDTLLAMGVIRRPVLRRFAASTTAMLHRRMTRLLIQSPVYRGPLEQQGVDGKQIDFVPNWAESLYRPIDVPGDAQERDSFTGGFSIVFAGNIGEAQGVDSLVRAMQELADLPDVNWVVLGDGRKAEWLAAEVSAAGLDGRVRILGRRPVESMPTWFALADVLVATLRPDPVFSSTIPSKLQSYLACGRPIVAGMDGEGARVIEESGAGGIAPAGDGVALAAAIRKVYEASNSERAEMGRRARQYYLDRFSREDVIDNIEQILIDEAERNSEMRKR